MNTAHWHLVLNHFPIVGTMVIGILITVAIITKNKGMTMSSYAALVVLSILGFIAFQTGEGAEEAVENLAGINKYMLHEHEEFAEKANILNVITGIFALVLLVLTWTEKLKKRWPVFIFLTVTYLTIGLMSYTGYLGGQIRHTEVNGQTQNNSINTSSPESDD